MFFGRQLDTINRWFVHQDHFFAGLTYRNFPIFSPFLFVYYAGPPSIATPRQQAPKIQIPSQRARQSRGISPSRSTHPIKDQNDWQREAVLVFRVAGGWDVDEFSPREQPADESTTWKLQNRPKDEK